MGGPVPLKSPPVSVQVDPNTNNNDKEPQTTAILNQSADETKKLSFGRFACEACRNRKVKCNREQPTCRRCAKIGNKCSYSTRTKPIPTKMDLSRFLLTLNSRLEQAEAQLAFSPPIQSSQLLTSAWGADMDMETISSITPLPPSTLPAAALGQPQLSDPMYTIQNLNPVPDKVTSTETTHEINEWFNMEDDSDFQFDPYTFSIGTDLIPDENQSYDFDPMTFDTSSSSMSGIGGSTVSPSQLQSFFDRFFEIFHPIMPLINRTRFLADISQPAPPIEVQALSYAVATLGALTLPELNGYVKHCYNEARSLLDTCERQETGESLTNINTLQACVLLTLYEFKRPNFARAWMTLGRAIRLAKIMGIDKVGINTIAEQWGLQNGTPKSVTPADLEERRRTCWVLYIFDSFASVRTNSRPAFDKLISVPLPSPKEYPEFSTANDNMPSLQQVFELSANTPLSSFAGTNVMIYLYQRCFDHVQSSLHEPSHAFWETHYNIEKAINHCRINVVTQHLGSDSVDDPLSLALRMNLNTVEINLHEAALTKIQKNELPDSLTATAISKCIAGATDTVEAIQLGQRLTGNKLEMFRQLDQFLIWPITTAIQVCFRMLYHGGDDVAPYINALRVLSSSMKDLIDPEHIAPGLLEKADERVAEAERSKALRRPTEN